MGTTTRVDRTLTHRADSAMMMVGENSTLKYESYPLLITSSNAAAMPRPNKMLNIGAAKQADTAICPNPCFVMMTLATRSTSELLHAMTDKPRTSSVMLRMRPTTRSKHISSLATKYIQMDDMT